MVVSSICCCCHQSMSFAHLCHAIPSVALAALRRPCHKARYWQIWLHVVAVSRYVPEASRWAWACSWSQAMCALRGGGDCCFLLKLLPACGLVGSGDAQEALLPSTFQWLPNPAPAGGLQ